MIILASEGDAQELKEFCIKAFADDKELYGAMPPNMDQLMWHKRNIKSGLYYKIVEDNRIVGGIKLFDFGRGHIRLGTIYIDPAYQNKHIGTSAMLFLENEFPKAKKWSLDTPYKSFRNHYFYEKHGYIKVGEEHPIPESEFCLFIYEKNKPAI